MKMRSLLFVPGDRPERFEKAANSRADIVILDLEDSVSLTNKQMARDAVRDYLSSKPETPTFVRINPLDSAFITDDLQAILVPQTPPAGIILPKAQGAASILTLQSMLGGQTIPILPIATETPAAIFELGSFREVSDQLCGLTWGAEDLPAAIGAATSRMADGSYTPPYEIARALTLFAAHAAGVSAIETVYPNIKDLDGLAAYAEAGARDGFTGMMAIHPAQIEVINRAFSPNTETIAWARQVVDAFAAAPDAGVLKLDGKMVDKPHLEQARKILERVAL